MSSEPRHGPVTMHRSIERKMLREASARPADARRAPAPAADAGQDADGARAETRPTRGLGIQRAASNRPGTPKSRRREDAT